MSVKATPEEEAEARRICRAAGDDPDAPSWQAYLDAAREYLAAGAAVPKQRTKPKQP